MTAAFGCRCLGHSCSFEATRQCVERKAWASVVLPTFREEANVGPLIEGLLAHVPDPGVEIIVVDDDSPDLTGEIVRARAGESPRVVCLTRRGARGLFGAIRDGIRLSRAEVVLLMDSDLSHPPEVAARLLARAREWDIVLATRHGEGGRMVAPWRRVAGHACLNTLARVVLGLAATDVLGGFHTVRRALLDRIEFRNPAAWGEFDLELLYRAQRLGASLSEIPYAYRFRAAGASKSRSLAYAWAYVKATWRLRLEGVAARIPL